ncbi:hypothetical protein [Gillisia limnaea]|uniref:Uncharacterized protein n=1 Tax=Gillisia limnaea (strain DSM 15749 / LMG 21470 / R-8282) TaxID=865937 RepID=H2BYP7_GILLR|nr:hypothetical protein [Gillisia limnaea]EHQ01168.1 hypothetical protein Gilli_0454 [Gillisia limnaea DSM 15749]
MNNTKAQKLLDKIQRDLMRNGIVVNTIVSDLKELRLYAVEEEDPLLAKVIRLTYEHIENYQTFAISIPEDEPVDELGDENESETSVTPEESLDYLLSLMNDTTIKNNEMDLREYSRDLQEYEEEN